MLDLKLILDNPEIIQNQLKIKKFHLDLKFLNKQNQLKRNLQLEVENLQNQRNQLSKKIGLLKKQNKNEQNHKYMIEVELIKSQLGEKNNL